MDEGLSGWEDRLRRELDDSVRDVRAGDGLVLAVREGGRRRVRRRRALLTLPTAVVVAGGAVWAGVSHRAVPVSAPPAAAPEAVAPTPVVATTPPVLEMDEEAARQVFFGAGYTYDDAVELAQLWNTDPYEVKALGGQALDNGEELPIGP